VKLAVFAYHDVGYECLRFLIEQSEEIVAVVTHEDDPDEEIWFRSVSDLARARHLPVYTPGSPNTPEFVGLIRGSAPDLILSFYYRRLLSKELLSLPRLGGVNLHGSLLPRYRGRSPVNWVLVNGETETGVTLHYMVEQADAGDIIAQRRVPIDIGDTALTLFHKVTAAGRELFEETFPLLKAGAAPRIPQDPRLATTFRGRRPEDGRVTWDEPATAIYNLVRAVTHPYPGAFTWINGHKLFIWQAAADSQRTTVHCQSSLPGTVQAVVPGSGVLVSTGDGSLLVSRAQFEGEKEMAADELAERQGIAVGAKLGE